MAPAATLYQGRAILISDTSAVMSNVTSASELHQNNLTNPEDCMLLDVSSWSFIPWDNPDNIISRETEKAFDTVVGAVCLPLLFLISAPSNLLNMLVFWAQGLKERINLCLFYLSLVDFLHMLNSFFVNVDRFRPPFTQPAGPVLEFIIDHNLVGFRGFTVLSGFVSALIACERCLCVVSPLHSHTILKTRTTIAILFVATVLIMGGSLMIGLRWSLICVFDPLTNTTAKVFSNSKFYKENKTHIEVLTFIIATSQQVAYTTIVSVTTVVTAVKLKKMVAWREQISAYTLSSREVALTRTLIAISVLYIVCSIPTIVTGISVMLVPDVSFSGRYYNLFQFVISLVELASSINATFNFFVYCLLGSKYRETVCAISRCNASVAKRGTSISK